MILRPLLVYLHLLHLHKTPFRDTEFIFSPLIQCDDQLLNRGYFHRYFAFMGNWERGGFPMINNNSLLINSLVSLSWQTITRGKTGKGRWQNQSLRIAHLFISEVPWLECLWQKDQGAIKLLITKKFSMCFTLKFVEHN